MRRKVDHGGVGIFVILHTIEEISRARTDKISCCRYSSFCRRLNNITSNVDKRCHLKGTCGHDLILDPEGQAIRDSLHCS